MTRSWVLAAWSLMVLGASSLSAAALGEGGPVARVAFVGDVMLAESEATGRLVAQGADPFAKVRSMLSAADLRVGNFEASAGTRGQPDADKPYSFRATADAVRVFASVFEAAGVANNHAGDFGREDFVETLSVLQAAGSTSFGGGRTPGQAHRAVVFERNGLKIALLGYLDFMPRWFSVAPGLPGVAWLDEAQAAVDIARAWQHGADAVVVIPHWGTENEPLANDRQRRIARALIDAGASAVIGGHPHVVQDYELYKGRPIVYSLGNFVFDGFDDVDNLHGWALFADFDRQGLSAIVTHTVRLDAEGRPSPVQARPGPCWERGRAAMSPCPVRAEEPTGAPH